MPTYGYQVVHTYPHDPEAFTEGLFYDDGFLYESTGRNGSSWIRKVDLDSGKVLQSAKVSNAYFGEGIAAWKGKIVSLTWQTEKGFVWDQSTLHLKSSFSYIGEGWGMTHDSQNLIMSDGTSVLKFLDPGTNREIAAKVESEDPLKFKDTKRYRDRIVQAQKQTSERDALIVMSGQLAGLDIVACAFEFRFLGGSMGSVVGEKLTRSAEEATRQSLPLIFVSGSGGGARMQEGILSLMQMAKVSAALGRYDRAGGLYISILTNPTMGGVAASFALQGDINLAEPGALIGFAGKRTIWNTVRLELPEGFQTSEFLMKHGFIDRIVPRRDLRTEVARIIDFCEH